MTAPSVTNESGVTYTDFHADTPEAMQNEKRALLAAMAEFGTEGQAELEKSKAAAKTTRANSIEMAAARGMQVSAPGTLQAELTQNYDAMLGGLQDNSTSSIIGHGREMDRIAAANAAYLDQVSGASQLNRDNLANSMIGLSGGGGRGGGGGGGGGKSSGSSVTKTPGTPYGPGELNSIADLYSVAAELGLQPTPDNLRDLAAELVAQGELDPTRAAEWTNSVSNWANPVVNPNSPTAVGTGVGTNPYGNKVSTGTGVYAAQQTAMVQEALKAYFNQYAEKQGNGPYGGTKTSVPSQTSQYNPSAGGLGTGVIPAAKKAATVSKSYKPSNAK